MKMTLIRPILWLVLLLAVGQEASAQNSKEESVTLARQELSRVLNIKGPSIRLLKTRDINWRDSSLGCPKKGMSYAQVITPGYLIHMSAKGTTHAVHVGGERAIVCRSEDRVASHDLGRRNQTMELIGRARADLEKRLEIEAGQVRLVKSSRGSWPNTSLGCPENGKKYNEVPSQGIQIEFAAQNQKYLYHSDMEQLVYCGLQVTPDKK
jgi:hypothetical protein